MSEVEHKAEINQKGLLAIEINDVYKSFKIPHVDISTALGSVTNFLKGNKYGYEELSVLNGINFSIKKGETFGIIGENGSGKSTLLKIIAGVLQPDRGSIQVNGRIAPFLELGVGFQPDLTAEENVRLYSSVMGIKKKGIDSKLHGIFQFAELERFKDMKLKNYSSGMYARLAFATAIATEPEIMLIDEALAVGDSRFQKKCLEHLKHLKNNKELTIILVTHNMPMLANFVDKAILLNNGRIADFGYPTEVINNYVRILHNEQNTGTDFTIHLPHVPFLKFESNTLFDKYMESLQTDEFDDSELIIVYSIKRIKNVVENRHVYVVISIGRYDGVLCSMHKYEIKEEIKEILNVKHSIKNINLLPGGYTLSMELYENDTCVDRFHFPLNRVKRDNIDEGMVFFENIKEIMQ